MLNRKKGLSVLLLSLAVTGVAVGCNSNKKSTSATAAVSAPSAVDESIITQAEASHFAGRGVMDSSLGDSGLMTSLDQLLFEEHSMGERILGLGLLPKFEIADGEGKNAERKTKLNVAKKQGLVEEYANLVSGEKREDTMPLVWRAYHLSKIAKDKGGIAAKSESESASYIVVILAAMKADNKGTFSGYTPDDVTYFAEHNEFTQVYVELTALKDAVAKTNVRIDRLAALVSEVEARLRKEIEAEKEARIEGDLREANARILGDLVEARARVTADIQILELLLAEVKQRQADVKRLTAFIEYEATVRKSMDDFERDQSKWDDAHRETSKLVNALTSYRDQLAGNVEKAKKVLEAAEKIPLGNKPAENTARNQKISDATANLSEAEANLSEASSKLKSAEEALAKLESKKPQAMLPVQSQ